jgi:hypothetical protein
MKSIDFNPIRRHIAAAGLLLSACAAPTSSMTPVASHTLLPTRLPLTLQDVANLCLYAIVGRNEEHRILVPGLSREGALNEVVQGTVFAERDQHDNIAITVNSSAQHPTTIIANNTNVALADIRVHNQYEETTMIARVHISGSSRTLTIDCNYNDTPYKPGDTPESNARAVQVDAARATRQHIRKDMKDEPGPETPVPIRLGPTSTPTNIGK